MANSQLRSLNDPVVSILQYSSLNQVSSPQNSDLLNLINQYPLPTFSTKDINNVNSNRQQGLSYANSFKNITYNFPYKKEILLSIIRQKSNIANNINFFSNSDFEIAARLILFSYISWMFKIENSKPEASDVKLILESLGFIARPTNFETVQDAFYYAFILFLSIDYNSNDFSVIISKLRKFLIYTRKSSTKADSFLDYIAGKLIPKNSNSFSESAIQVINLISELVDNYNFKFSTQSAENIIMITSRWLLNFDLTSLRIFGSLVQFISDKTKFQIIEMISNTLKINIDQAEKVPEFKYSTVHTTPLNSPTSIQFCFPETETFIDGFDINHSFNSIETPLSYKNLISPDLLEKVTALCQALHKHPLILNQIFSSIGKCIKSCPENKILPSLAFLVAFFYEIRQASQVSPPAIEFLCVSKLFDPNIISDIYLQHNSTCPQTNIDNSNTDLEKISAFNTLRHFALGIIIEESEISLGSIIGDSSSSPQFIHEMFLRLLDYKPQLLNIFITSKYLLKQFSLIISTLKGLSYEGHHETDLTRLAFLQLISYLISNSDAKKNIFEDMYFMSSYLTFLFDLKVRPLILQQLEDYLKEASQNPQSAIISAISSIIELMRVDLNEDCNSTLIVDLVQMMNRVLEVRPETTKMFSVGCTAIFDAYQNVVCTEKCQEFFKASIEFLIHIYPTLSIGLRYKDVFINVSKILYKENPPYEILEYFIRLMFSDLKATIHTNDKIKHQVMIPVLFEVFEFTEYISDIIDLYDKLLDDTYNIILFNSTNFDKYLLMKFVSTNSEKIKGLFTKIALSSTTVSVVLNYISLLAPIKGQYLPSNLPILLNYMYELLQLSLENQLEVVNLDPSLPFKPLYLNIPKNFTYCAWIYIDKMIPQYFPTLFSAVDEKGRLLELFITLQKIKIQTDPSRNGCSTILDYSLPICQWSLVSISFFEQDDIVKIELNVNGKLVAGNHISKAKMPEGKWKITFCGALKQSINTNNQSLTGPFAIYNQLDNASFNQILNEEQRFFGRNLQEPIYMYQPYSLGPRQKQFSFASILVMKCRLEILCPLFRFIGYTFEDGTEYKDFTDVIFKIFGRFFYFGSSIEESFTYSRGFGIIEQVLLENDPCVLTFDLYLRFYNLLLSFQTEKLKSNLLESILLNMQLWVAAPSCEQIQIQKHWLNVLFPNYLSIINTFLPFTAILNLIVLNYHEKMDSSVITSHFSRKIPDDFNLQESLQIMFHILYIVAMTYFKPQDFALLVSYALKSRSPHLIYHIMNLIKQLIHEFPSPMTPVLEHKKCLALMHSVIKNGGHEISKLMVETIVELHKTHLILDPSLTEHLNIIIREINIDILDHEYLDFMIQIMKNGTPEMFPLCCWIASNLPQGEFEHMLEGIEPSNIYITNKFWSIWPIVLANKSDATFSAEVIRFLASCSKDEWINLFSMIEIVCSLMKKSSSPLKRILVKKFLQTFHKEGIDFLTYDQNVIQLIYNYIFFRDITYDSISCMFSKSPFAELRRSHSLSFTNPKKTKMSEFKRSASLSFRGPVAVDSVINLFEGPDPQIGTYMFGVRFDANGKWIDRDIGTKLLHFLFQAKTPYHMQFKLLVLFFMLHDNEDKRVYDYSRSIIIPDDLKEQLQPLIDLVCFQLQRNKYKNLRIYSSMSENYKENGLNFYDQLPTVSVENEVLSRMKEIRLYSQTCSVLSGRFLSAQIDHYIKSWEKSQRTAFTIIIDSELNREKAWKMLFQSLIIPNTPWQSLSPSNRCLKRDPIQCFGFCPFRMKEGIITDTLSDIKKYYRSTEFKIQDNRFSNCQIITVDSVVDASINITDKEVRFSMLNNKVKRLSLESISKIWRTTVLHRLTAFEIVFDNGISFIVNFPSDSICTEYYDKLVKYSRSLSIPTNEWLCGDISNFEYLMALNLASGRSFNNATQYPIFPWVLSDYSSENLDLSNEAVFRDLSKPSGALNSRKLQSLIEKMSENSSKTGQIYLYFKAMNNNRTVFNFLQRIYPFLNLSKNSKQSLNNIEKVDGISKVNSIEQLNILEKVDNPESVEKKTTRNSSRFNINFDSIKDEYESVLNNLNNNNELIPEFFYCPEFLVSSEPDMENVELPKWASSPMDFIYKNRKALESDYVSNNLHNWIDLIWGYKQRGSNALDNFNTYHPMLYDNALSQNTKDMDDIIKTEVTKVKNGQIPKQLFTLPHERRKKLTDEGIKAFTIRTDIKNVYFSTIYGEKETQFTVCVVDENWKKYLINLFYRDNQFTFDIKQHDFSNSVKFPIKNARFVGCRDNLIVAASQSMVLSSTNQVNHVTKRYLCVAADKNWMLTICADSVIYLFSSKNIEAPKRRLHFYRETPICACVNSEFHVFIIGTKDGILSIYPLEKGSSIRTIDLDQYTPRKVVVTPAWGFIVTYATKIIDAKRSYVIFVHTINGILVRSYTLTAEITAMTAIRSKSGFDYVAVASKLGAVFVCEAYSLTFEKPALRLESPIIMLSYNKKMKALVGVSVDGTIICQSIEILIS
ncbi:hypothetical protein TRFO_28716 [Tritrichomonas foetus]|uniref:Beige/BEACH domain containing protein n=1 Tax=Tritrichomonas foetus TaxID=1144522 RepID=A0A1J4K2H2_9EUKA|nr:hypothetical protein TRFO_28716 [Tritrichomonas foetus]|eukprot:OHT03934.1 hypothetical protein TRFO_28716 [Tritrichomonas foetus]